MSDIQPQDYNMTNWQASDLAKPDNLALLESLINDYSNVTNQGDCHLFYLALNDLFNKYQSELDIKIASQYKKFIISFGILSWHNRREEEKRNYLANNLLYILKCPLPIMALVSEEVAWYKWKFREILDNYMSYIDSNQELLGGQGKNFSFTENENNPTVANWLKDFIISAGSPEQLNPLNFIDYFSQNNNVKLLTDSEIKLLKRLLKFYSILSTPLKNDNFFQRPYLFDDYFETGEQPGETVKLDFKTEAKKEYAEDKLSVIKEKYNRILSGLQETYNINQKIKDYKDLSPEELIKLLNNSQGKAADILGALTLLVDKDKNLNVFKISSPSDFSSEIKRYLLNSGLTEDQAAVYLIHLAKINKQLAGLAYADLRQNNFVFK